MQISHLLDLFFGGLITIAALFVLLASKNTANVVNAFGSATTGSLRAAEGQGTGAYAA